MAGSFLDGVGNFFGGLTKMVYDPARGGMQLGGIAGLIGGGFLINGIMSLFGGSGLGPIGDMVIGLLGGLAMAFVGDALFDKHPSPSATPGGSQERRPGQGRGQGYEINTGSQPQQQESRPAPKPKKKPHKTKPADHKGSHAQPDNIPNNEETTIHEGDQNIFNNGDGNNTNIKGNNNTVINGGVVNNNTTYVAPPKTDDKIEKPDYLTLKIPPSKMKLGMTSLDIPDTFQSQPTPPKPKDESKGTPKPAPATR